MSIIQPRPGILDIAPYVPGNVDLTDPEKVVFLGSNESPLGASPAAIKAFTDCATKLHFYPDAGCKLLRAAIADNYAVNAEQIVCGNGSERLIDFIAKAYAGPGDDIVYSEYGFIMYPICALAAGAKPVKAAERNFKTDIDAVLATVTENTRIVFLANPNNPTGTYLNSSEIQSLRQRLPERVLLVIDAAYAEYVTAEDYTASRELVNNETSNVVVLHTFSKIYGLASLRLGWAYCPTAVADILNRVRGSFTISGPAQAAGIAAVNDRAHTALAKEHNSKWLPWLTQALLELGLDVIPSAGNFVLVRFGSAERCRDAHNYLSRNGVILRPMAGYGLPDALRITVGTERQNQTCIEALQAFFSRSYETV
jgi:histidinol-phosphate aminotransferase